MNPTSRLLLVALCGLMLSGCDVGQFTQTQKFDDYVLSLTNDPQPIVAQQPVKLWATLRRERSSGTGCEFRMSKAARGTAEGEREPAMEMPEASRSGIYRAENVMFAHDGDWDIFLKINCFGRKRELVFPLVVTSGK